jgi:hypothetical protein
VSSVAEIAIASGTFTSVVETYIPLSQKGVLILVNYTLNLTDFGGSQTAAALQNNRIQPKFGNPIVSLHVYVRRFYPVPGIEEKAIRPRSQYGWH